MPKDKMYSGKSDSGVKAAQKRNPNKETELNDTPCGPHAVTHGEPGYGGMHGDTSVKTSRGSFNFK